MRLLWQLWIAVLVVGSLAATALWLVQPTVGDFGLTTHSVGNDLVIDSVAPNSSAARAGLHAGETVVPSLSFDQLLHWSAPLIGDRVTITRANGQRITLVAQQSAIAPALLLITLVPRIAFALMAALLVWRLSSDPAARALATFLAAYGAAIRPSISFWQPDVLRFADFICCEALFFIGTGAFALFTCRFPAPATSGWRTVFRRSIIPLVILGIALSATRLTQAIVYIQPAYFRPLLTAYAVVMFLLIAGAVASLVQSYRESAGVQRVRVLWVLRTFAVGFSGVLAMLALVPIVPDQRIQFVSITIVLIPIGLAYVILRHRVLDIGFVVNRAVVYTAVSLILVGAFVIFEWFIGHVFELQASTSTLLQLGAALALGMSTRFIHGRVDRYVDDLFFRERHQAEAAIRAFAHEALLITDPNDLTTKTVEVAQRNARLSGAAYYFSQGGEFVALHSTFDAAPTVGENDYAVLAMRAWHHSVDLHQYDTRIPGDVAFPMLVRGQLAGLLACGEKASHEALAPDESEALALLARDAGIALDSLHMSAIRREVAALTNDGLLPELARKRLAALVAIE